VVKSRFKQNYLSDLNAINPLRRRRKDNIMVRVGVHVSIAKSIDKAVDRALEKGCDTFQIFTRNPRGWKLKELTAIDAKRFTEKVEHSGLFPPVDHMPYLPNLAAPTDDVAVDTHVHRISNRLGLVSTKSPYQTEFALRKTLPKRYWIVFNNLLVMHGKTICTPISPKCSICPITEYCKRIGVTRYR